MGVLERLQNTQLTTVSGAFRPLSSSGSRERRCTCCTYLCCVIRDALNLDTLKESPHCDCVLINGGNFRGSRDYAAHEQFTLESLKAEIDESVHIVIAQLPGSILRDGLRQTWLKPGGGWMQYDEGVEIDEDGLVAKIGGEPLDETRVYRVGTSHRFGVRLIPKVAAYFEGDSSRMPNEDSGIHAHALIMSLFAEKAWSKMVYALDVDHDGILDETEFDRFDVNHTGMLNREDVLKGLHEILGFSTDDIEMGFVDMILRVAGDLDGTGHIPLIELNDRLKGRFKEQDLLRVYSRQVGREYSKE